MTPPDHTTQIWTVTSLSVVSPGNMLRLTGTGHLEQAYLHDGDGRTALYLDDFPVNRATVLAMVEEGSQVGLTFHPIEYGLVTEARFTST